MNQQPTPERTPDGERLVDSPWFWVCLFASAAVVALLAIGPKYRQREARLESTFRMREHLTRSSSERATGRDENIDKSIIAKSDVENDENGYGDDGRLIRSTGPLIWILAAVVAGGWAALFWTRRRTGGNLP